MKEPDDRVDGINLHYPKEPGSDELLSSAAVAQIDDEQEAEAAALEQDDRWFENWRKENTPNPDWSTEER